jgi:hypothetical protein
MDRLQPLAARARQPMPFPNVPTSQIGINAALINNVSARAYSISRLASPGAVAQRSSSLTPSGVTLEERLYGSRAACKIRTATVAMHLDAEWRSKLFAQIDSLLGLEDWDPLDAPVIEPSFATFLRMLLLVKPKRRPGIGATHDGNIVAMWTRGSDRLTVTCLAADNVKWSVVRIVEGDRESAAGQTALPRLLGVLQPYAPELWFADDGQKTSA